MPALEFSEEVTVTSKAAEAVTMQHVGRDGF